MSALPAAAFAAATDHASRLHLLVEVLERMAAVRDWPTLMQTVRRAARALTGADGATLVLRDGDQCHYVDEDAIGPLWKHQRFPLEHCISGIAMTEARAIVIPDIRRDPRVPQAAYATTFVRAMTMVPIGRSEPVGAIGCYWARVYEASAEELRLHQTLADATITAITNIRLNRGLEAARETAERAAAEANAAFEQAAVGMAQLDTQGRCRRVNARLCQILGLTPDDLLGLEFDALHEHPPQAREARGALLAGADGRADELRLRHAGGRLLWVQLTQSLVRGPDGAASGLIAVVEDIGARKAAQSDLARSRETFRRLAEMSSDYFWATDAQHRISEVSSSMYERSGLDGSRFLGRARWELPTLDIAPADWQEHRAALAGQQHFAGLEMSLLNVHGERRWLKVAGTPVYDEQGRFDGYRGVTQDVTERRRAEHLLRQQAAVFSTVQEGIVITDLDGRVLATNPAFTTITEYAPDELLGHGLEERLRSGRHPDAFYAARQLALREQGEWAGAQWSRRKSGAVYQEWVTVSTVRGPDGAALNRIWVQIDLSRMARTETDLEREALHDPLTGLPNRRLLMSRLERSLEQARRHRRHGALLYLDLDRFKPVNDVHGHAAGDELLQQVAQRWRGRLREADTLARIGGDEFIVLLDETAHPEDAIAVADSLCQALEAPFTLAGGQQVRVGSSVGLALFPGQADEAAALLLLADQALYAAKRAGRRAEATHPA